MNSYYYKQIKDAVTMTDVLNRYGIDNKKGFAFCPFHNEKTASLKIYDNSFYCFGCGEGGDVISFVSKLFNISQHEAAELIGKEFHIGLDGDNKPSFRTVLKYEKEKQERENFEKLKIKTANVLTAWFRYLDKQRRNPLNVDFHLANKDLWKINYYLDCLVAEPTEFLKFNKKAVRDIEQELSIRGIEY